VAGYSGTPLLKKLGIKPGMTVLTMGEPAVYSFPSSVKGVSRIFTTPVDMVHFFVKERRLLEKYSAKLGNWIKPTGMVWVSWPKGASKVETDLSERIVRAQGRTG
jgi:hypothetical protein